jgi:LmbE family N-acetylglucosaminyl deacetylase
MKIPSVRKTASGKTQVACPLAGGSVWIEAGAWMEAVSTPARRRHPTLFVRRVKRDRTTGASHLKALLAVFAHPDDESFRSGGTLALLARRGVRVHLLTATHGEAGSCGDPPLCMPEELPAVRERELCCACAALGVEPPRLLGYRDGHLSEADSEEITAQVLSIVDEVRPQVMLSFGPDGLSGHPDHVAIGQCAAEAFRHRQEVATLYTVAVPRSVAEQLAMQRVWSVPDEAIALSVDVSAVWETKLSAIRCHATQLSSSPMTRAPVERQRLFFGTEHFVRAATRQPDRDFMENILRGDGL